MKLKLKNKKLYFSTLLFLVVVGFGILGNLRPALADCQCTGADGKPITFTTTETNCVAVCTSIGSTIAVAQTTDQCAGLPPEAMAGCYAAKGLDATTNYVSTEITPYLFGWTMDVVAKGISTVLIYVLKFLALLLPVAASIFGYVADASIIPTILNSQAVTDGWGMVRDMLNMAFILVLIFTAFSTIFQIEKYNYKKLLLTLVLMALLVNFSFPITRFVIDVSNSLMYTLTKTLFDNLHLSNLASVKGQNLGVIFNKILEYSGLNGTIVPNTTETPDLSVLLAAIVFVFLFAATLLTISVLFAVRLMAFAILIIFSPIGFVGSIFPGTSSFANKFWDNLMRYAFFGPIMMFMLYLATQITILNSNVAGRNMKAFLIDNSSVSMTQFLANLGLGCIPLVILWLGMGVAQQMSIAGAEGARKFGMGAMNRFSGVNWLKRNYADYRKERDARNEDARWKAGRNLGRRANELQDTIVGGALGRVSGNRLGGAARRRVLTARQTRNREEITNRAQADNHTGAELLTNLNNHGVATALNPNAPRGDKRTYASEATALRNMQDSELRRSIATSFTNLHASASTSSGIFDGVTGAERTRALVALTNVNNATASNDDFNLIISHIRSRAGDVVRDGINNG